MKPANRAPLFACMYHGLANLSREHGYALAIHGSVTTDLDVIAVPWTDKAISAVELKDILMKHISACGYGDMLRRDGLEENLVQQILDRKDVDEDPTKPHGRLCWNLYLEAGAKIDLSVMPRIP